MIDPDLNLNALRVFAVAAHHRNFQRAAEVLNLSHGAVSQRIRQLEADLDVTLFHRQARGVALTQAGEVLFRATQDAFPILSRAVSELRAAPGEVTLHLVPSMSTNWKMPRMADLRAQCPGLALSTEVHDRPLDRPLQRNELAIWPGRVPYQHPTHAVQRLCALQIVVVCSPDLNVPDGPVDPETLLTFPLLQDAHRRWDALAARIGAPAPTSVLNFDRSALALDAALNGHGIALAPTIMTDQDVRAGRLCVVWSDPVPTGEDVFMSWVPTDRRRSPLDPLRAWCFAQFGAPAD